MRIGAASDQAVAARCEAFAQRFGVVQDALRVIFEVLGRRFLCCDSEARGGVVVRSTLEAWEYCTVDLGSELLFAHDHPAAWTAEGFVRCRGDDVRQGYGVRVESRGNEARNVRDVRNKVGADFVRDLTENIPIDNAGVCGDARHNHLGLVLTRKTANLSIVE